MPSPTPAHIRIETTHLHHSRPIDSEDLSIDPLSVLAGEETDDTGDINWETDTVERRPGGSVLRQVSCVIVRGGVKARTSSTWSSVRFSPLGMYSLQTLWYMSVLIPPGAMQLTVICLSPKSDMG